MKPQIFTSSNLPMLPLNGLIDWIDASDSDFALDGSGNPLTSDGQILKYLKDKSAGGVVHGGANNMSQWKTNVQNGLSVWRNTTLNQWTTILAFNYNFSSRKAVEIFSVFRPSIVTGKRAIYFVSTSVANNTPRIGFGLNNGNLFAEGRRIDDEADPTYVEGGSIGVLDFKLASVLFDYESGNIVLSSGGQDWGTTLPTAGESHNIDPIAIRLSGMVGQDWRGDIGEILVYNQKLSSSEREQVRNYLKIKWNVS